MRRIRTLAAVVIAASATVGALWVPTLSDAGAVPEPVVTSAAPPPAPSPSATRPAERTLTWSDEFNAAAGTGPDRARWNFDTGSHGWGNRQLEYYTTSTRNAVHDGAGHLVITAREENPGGAWCPYGYCRYTSARLVTNGTFAQLYGRFEARMRLPYGQGVWPAFWMLGDDFDEVGWPASGEIDVMENVGKEPNTVYGTVHGPGYSAADGVAGSAKAAAPLSKDFHTYAVEWSPGLIVFLLDGVEYHRVTPADVGGDRWVFDKPYHLLLNLAIGGAWPGAPNASTVFPQTLTVDWIRVWAYEPAWAAGRALQAGQVVTYDGAHYRVLRAHTALAGWEPPAATGLFARV
ncbi:hypothetical protein Sya03_03940 [Spirilliplanes yamanashiensis]|uniref:GH16 domain-containing protein n=1 Tax=Spirilliplanes yamanashiensis TaxID=42233 RepID=A0A8J3Y3V3_9ACTN|nr:hypothetical protein Sya03_03940 [Spirilliplanes yamanashiensis]